jgi:hypothetical protein
VPSGSKQSIDRRTAGILKHRRHAVLVVRQIICATFIFRRRLPIQSEFSVLKINLMAVPCTVVILPPSARVQLDDPISSAAGIQLGGGERSI